MIGPVVAARASTANQPAPSSFNFGDLIGKGVGAISRPPAAPGASVGSAPAVPQGVNQEQKGGNLKLEKASQKSVSTGGSINIGGGSAISGTVWIVLAVLAVLAMVLFFLLR